MSFNLAAADEKAQLREKLAKLHSLSAEFAQTVTDAQGEMLQQLRGKLTLQQPQKLYWQVYEPNENLLIADGTTLWQVDPFVEQVIAINQQQAIANNPMVLLTSNEAKDWQDFAVTRQQDKWLVTALQQEAPIASLLLVFEQDSLTGFSLTDRQGQISQFVFSQIKQNQQVDPKLFIFTLPSGYDLDDQRN